MSKQLILITAPFNCGYCKKAQEELPTLCESKGWELIEIEDDDFEQTKSISIAMDELLENNIEYSDTLPEQDENEK